MNMAHYTDFNHFASEQLKDPVIKKEYDRLEPEFLVASALIELRLKKKLTQTALAKLTKLDQSEIAKMENCSRNVTVKTLHRIAQATGTKLTIKLA